jgi:fatty-acyl-CoA synthase
LRALQLTAGVGADPRRILPLVVEEVAERFGDIPALLSKNESLSYRQLAERARRFSRWALAWGVEKGEVIGLMARNRPEYVAAWLGLTRIGATVALISPQLRDQSLAHSAVQARCRRIIADAEFEEALIEAVGSLDPRPEILILGNGTCATLNLASLLEAQEPGPLDPEGLPVVKLEDRALLIYTSGTTGLPKAARISHLRIMLWSRWFTGLLNASPADRLYNCLPMHHSVGGVVAVGSMLVAGASVAIAERFSATGFWDDVTHWDCTLFQYIGDICRYLASTPEHPLERSHRLRMACGNGLSADIWIGFQERFAIPRILEFYAATEGVFSLFNVEGRPGAIGRVPPFLSHRFPAVIVRHDMESGAPLRDSEGRCVRCEPGETGQALGRITGAPGEVRFEGYTNNEDTEKKILRNVFEKGDTYFATGDLMRHDHDGFVYFMDRIGDTFRWKGENVSTQEVAHALTEFPGVRAACVYGVVVPYAEGRAGMAAMVADSELDMGGLYSHLVQRLPPYARPLFVRLVKELETTETFKTKTRALIDEGFDPGKCGGQLYFVDRAAGGFTPLRLQDFASIASGAIRF